MRSMISVRLFRCLQNGQMFLFCRNNPRFSSCNANAATNADSAPPTEDQRDQSNLVAQIESMKKELEKLVKENEEITDKYKRALAESENMRKRLMRQIDEAKIFGIQSFCKDLLEVADILTKATESAPAEQLDPKVNQHFVNLFEGLKMTEQQMLQVFARHNLVRVNPVEGEKFDPNIHEAVFQAPLKDGKQPNTVATVTKVGYKLHDRTLRPAFVGVFGPS